MHMFGLISKNELKLILYNLILAGLVPSFLSL